MAFIWEIRSIHTGAVFPPAGRHRGRTAVPADSRRRILQRSGAQGFPSSCGDGKRRFDAEETGKNPPPAELISPGQDKTGRENFCLPGEESSAIIKGYPGKAAGQASFLDFSGSGSENIMPERRRRLEYIPKRENSPAAASAKIGLFSARYRNKLLRKRTGKQPAGGNRVPF